MDESVGNTRLKRRQVLLHAEEDMLEARAAAVALQETADLYLVLALGTALSVAYARPFQQTNTVGALSASTDRPPDAPLADLHDALLRWRDKTYAHTDKVGGRSTQLYQGPSKSSRTVRFERKTFPRARLDDVIALCDLRRERFATEADELDRALHEP